jgi:mannose-6-phosphate isomerase-like protein (cupin superfamily)
MIAHLRTAAIAAFAFVVGFLVAHATLTARAAAPALSAAAIDLTAITPDSMPTPSATLPNLRSKTLVIADGMTAAFQVGTAPKHYHADANEIQIVIAGTGTEWLGNQQVPLKPGTMLIIPTMTNHAGTVATSGQLEILSIKTPPQAPTDVHLVP